MGKQGKKRFDSLTYANPNAWKYIRQSYEILAVIGAPVKGGVDPNIRDEEEQTPLLSTLSKIGADTEVHKEFSMDERLSLV